MHDEDVLVAVVLEHVVVDLGHHTQLGLPEDVADVVGADAELGLNGAHQARHGGRNLQKKEEIEIDCRLDTDN